jgi:G3E family GTPase
MTKLLLVTGFLGAGKTTFLKRLINHFSNMRLHVIVNEFGAAGVDGHLLREMQVAVDEISNGSIFCSCRWDKFEETLLKALDSKPDLILVEASGLSDPTGIDRLLCENTAFAGIKPLGSICLIDALRFEKVVSTARVVKKQLAAADMVLLNKCDLAGEEILLRIEKTIASMVPDLPVHRTEQAFFKPEWLSELRAGNRQESGPHTRDLGLTKASVRISSAMTPYQLERFLQVVCEDAYRVKGFVRLTTGNHFVDCVGPRISITPFENPPSKTGTLVVLAGPGLPMQKTLKAAAEWYPDLVEILS